MNLKTSEIDWQYIFDYVYEKNRYKKNNLNTTKRNRKRSILKTRKHNAQYIPALKNVDPNLFSISVCTVDGYIYSVGDFKHKFAIESFAEYLLPVMDSMHAAMEHHNEDINKLKEGVELTLKQMKAALEKGKIVEIHPEIGSKFDPHHHQAIATVASDQESNTIVTVLQKGYLIADRVLRPALVTVSQPK